MAISDLLAKLRKRMFAQRASAHVARRRLRVMRLEDRRLPDAGFAILGGILTLDGFDALDTLTVNSSGGAVQEFTLQNGVWDSTSADGVTFVLSSGDQVLTVNSALSGLNIDASGDSLTAINDGVNGARFGSLAITDGGQVTLDDISNDFDSVSIDADSLVLQDVDEVALDGIALSGDLQITAQNAITDVDNTSTTAAGAVFSASGITLGDQAGDTTNFDTVTFNTTGTVSLSEESSIDIVGTNSADVVTLSSPDTVTLSGSLSGVSDINGTLTVGDGGQLMPAGTAPGGLATDNIEFQSGSTVQIDIDGLTAATDYDQISTIGTVTLDGTLNIDLDGGLSPADGTQFTIIDNDDVDAVTGTFDGLAEGDTLVAGGQTFVISYVGGDGNDVVLSAGTAKYDFSSADYNIAETDADFTDSSTVTLTRSGNTSVATSVDVILGSGTATAGTDFAAGPVTVTFAAGETSKTVAIDVLGDLIVETDETILLSLDSFSSGGSAGSTNSTATIKLTSNDTGSVTVADATHAENSTFTFTLTLDRDTSRDITVVVDTADLAGEAVAGSDYTAITSQTVTFSANGGANQTQTVTVTLNNESIVEANETFTLNVSDAQFDGATDVSRVGIGDAQAIGTISNDDSASISVASVSADETDSGTTTFVFNVQLSAAVQDGLSVAFSTADGTAISTVGPNQDYVANSGTLNFAGTAGETHTVSVTVLGDDIYEGTANQQFTVQLGTITTVDAGIDVGTFLSTNNGTGTIVNDDTPVLLFIDGSGNLFITDKTESGQDDSLTVSFDAGTGEIVVTSPVAELGTGSGVGSTELRFAAASVTGQVVVDSAAGNDALTVDLATGGLTTGITFDGGSQTVSDGLAVIGDGSTVAVYSPDATTPGKGIVQVDGQTISFTGLEPIDISGMASATLNLPLANDLLDIANGTDFFSGGVNDALVVSGSSGGVAIETAAFWNNTTLNISTSDVDGNDSITITSADNGHANTHLNLSTGSGTDSVVFNGDVSLAGNLSVNSSAISINTGSISTGGTQAWSGPIELQQTSVLTGTTVSFAQTIDSAPAGNGLTITGNARFSDTVGQSTALGSLHVTGSTLIDTSTIMVTGTQQYDAAVTLDQNTQLTATMVTFGSTVDSASGETNALTISGSATFAGAVGSSDALSSISVNGTTADFQSTVVVGSGGLDVDAVNTIHFGAAVSTTGGGTVSLTHGGLMTLDAAADFTIDGAFQQDGAGSVQTAADVTTTGDSISFLSDVTLTGHVQIVTTSAGNTAGAAIGFDSVSGTHNLTLDGGTAGTVTTDQMSNLAILTITDSGNTSVNGAASAGSIIVSDTSGNVTFADAVAATLISIINLVGDISFEGSVTATSFVTAAAAFGVRLNHGGLITNAVTFNNTAGVTIGNQNTDSLTFTAGVTSTASATTVQGSVLTGGADITLGTTTFVSSVTLDTGAAAGNITTGQISGSGVATILDAGTGNITLTNTANVIGDLTATGNTVSITEADAITQSAAWTTIGETTLNAGSNQITLTQAANSFGVLNLTATGATVVENTDLHLGTATITNTLDLTTDAAILDALVGESANITATSAALKAATGIGSADDINLQVSTLAFTNSTSGNVALQNSGGLRIDDVAGLTASFNNGGTVLLQATSPVTLGHNTTSAGMLTVQALESATTNFDNITVEAGVAVQSTTADIVFEAGDRIQVDASAVVSAVSGNVTLDSGFADTDGDGAMTLNGAIQADNAAGTITLDLNSQQAAVQGATGSLTGHSLQLNGLVTSGSFALTDSTTNDVSVIAASTAGSIAYRDSSALTVSTVSSAGISTTAADLTLCAESISVTQNIAAGTGTIRLQATAGSIIQTGGSITAGSVGAIATGNIQLTGTGNDWDMAAASAGGSLALVDADGFAAGTVTAATCFDGATDLTSGGDTDICVLTGDLEINAAIDAAGSTVRLQADNGSIIQWSGSTITADRLGVRATGDIDLDQTSNQVASTFAAASTGSGTVMFLNQSGFTVGAIAASSCFTATTGVTTADGNVDLIVNSGTLISQEVIEAGGTGDVSLSTTTAGDIQIHSVTAVDNTVKIVANGGGGITELGSDAAADIVATNLELIASGGIGSTGQLEIDATTLAAVTTAGDIHLRDVANGLTVGAVGGTTGLSNVSGASTDDIVLTAAGTITVDSAVTNANGGNVLLHADAVAANVAVNSTVGSAGGHITVVAHSSITMSAGSSVQTSGSGTLNIEAGDGSVQMDAASTLSSVDGDIRVIADTQVVVGDITATNANVALTSSIGSVLDADLDDLDVDVTAVGLRINAASGIGVLGAGTANALETSVTTVAGRATRDGINLLESDAVIVDDVAVTVQRVDDASSTTTVNEATQSDLRTTAGNGSIVLRTLAGSVTLNDGTAAAADGAVSADGDGNLLIEAGTAGSLNINADVVSGQGDIHLMAHNSILLNSNTSVSTASDGTIHSVATTGTLTMDATAEFSTSGGDIQLQSSADLTIGDIIAGSGQVAVTSVTGSVIDADMSPTDIDITASAAILNAGVAVGTSTNAIETTVATISVRSGDGGLHIVESNGLIVDDVTVSTNSVNADATTTANSVLLQSDLRTTGNGGVTVNTLAGSLTLNEGTSGAGDGAVFASGTGNVQLTAEGAGSDINVSADITATSGSISLKALQSVFVNAGVDIATAGTGTIAVEATNGVGTMDATANLQSLDGSISVLADGTVTVGSIVASNANVSITSQTAAIINVDVVAGDSDVTATELTASAVSQITLDTTVDVLDASTSGAGNIDITEFDAIVLRDVDTADGLITVIAGGLITATDVQSLTDVDANDIRLASTDDGIHVGQINAGTDGDVLLIAHGDITQDATGSILAEQLGIRQQSTTVGSVTLGGLNDVDVVAIRNLADGTSSSTVGNVTLFDIGELLVDTIAADVINGIPFAATTGINTNAGDINITSQGTLTINQNIDAAHDSLTTSIDETITLISRNGDFILLDGLTITSDENPAAGVFDDITGDQVTIVAGSSGTNGHVDLGSNIDIRTDGGSARQIAPRPQAFVTTPTAFVTMKSAAEMRSNLTFVDSGFLGVLELVFGVTGEENLEVVIDWGPVTLTDLVASGPAGDASPSLTNPGALEFSRTDADKTIFYIDEGGREYVIPHIYEVGDLVTTTNDRNGRQNNPNIMGVRISVAQHESISVWGTSASDPTNPGNTETPDEFTSSGSVESVTDARGNAIGLPTSGLSLLSSTDTNPLHELTQQASPLPFSNVVLTPTGTPEGLAEWEFIAGPSPGLVLLHPEARTVADIPVVDTPVDISVISDPPVSFDFGTGAISDAAIGTDVYLQIRRQFELDVEAEVVIPVIRDNGFISSRDSFEEFVRDNPELQDGAGYEVWLITETAGQRVERPIVRFEITGGRPGPATEELPETFEPYQLRELEFDQPEDLSDMPATDEAQAQDAGQDQTLLLPEGDNDNATLPGHPQAAAMVASATSDDESHPTESPAHADHAAVDNSDSAAATTDADGNRNAATEAEATSMQDQLVTGSAVVIGSLARSARWKRKRQNKGLQLTRTGRTRRRLEQLVRTAGK